MNVKRRGAETGSGFQEAINRVNEAYERQGRACITRKAIPGKYLIEKGESRRGLSVPGAPPVNLPVNLPVKLEAGRGQARIDAAALSRLVREQKVTDWRRFIPESKAEPDYGGVLAPGGRGIFYDAKTTRRELLDFDNLHAHQIGFLERSARFGAVAGFLVEFSKYRQIYFLPVQIVVRWREAGVRKSIPYPFFRDHLIPAPSGRGMILFDYLSAVEEQETRYGSDFSELELTIPTPRGRKATSR
ncbi:MAG: Holliday junction resolvase RecU [Blastocatellia bacterium]|nr:Holliday junction resolvase RecU [Blastocatellia bacterium]